MLIVTNNSGQLGNRLFAFCHMIAFAKTNGIEVANLAFAEYAHFFENTSNDLWCRYPIQRSLVKLNVVRLMLSIVNRSLVRVLRMFYLYNSPVHAIVVADIPEFRFDDDKCYDLNSPSFKTIAATKWIVFIFGRFFRDYNSLQNNQEEVRDFFRPAYFVKHRLNLFVVDLRDNCDVVVGVHLRRGDYRDFAAGKYYYTLDQYYIVMRKLRDSMSATRLRFVVSSDEQIELAIFEGLDVRKAPGHVAIDLFLLAACDRIMGPPSTFSRFASFYGKKPIYTILDPNADVTFESFEILPTHVMFNYSFN